MSTAKEATARIKINSALESAGWGFFAHESGPANIALESGVKLTHAHLDALGSDLEKARRGFVDFLLLDSKGFPLIVLEAKSENKHPLVGKEQARKYAQSLGCAFIILSNGNLHYFWDLRRGNPQTITAFPSPDSVTGYRKVEPDRKKLVAESIESDYVALSQYPQYKLDAGWKNESERGGFIHANKLRFLRDYQLNAVHTIQIAVRNGLDRFLLEMATGTGKTLTAAAVIKLFLKTQNASRVLFLVDRLELESQAERAFSAVLSRDYKSVIYKENRDDWRKAEIVVTTVQSLLFNNKYRSLFSPTDFDLVISDEAHRSIGGNARAVFDYFVGYKLGLTATPKDYLRKLDRTDRNNDPREVERRILLDTYRTFGCESGQPTFRYSLLDGVRDGYLINPTVVDARTDVTTKLLSEHGFVVNASEGEAENAEEVYKRNAFERRFFSEATNVRFCLTFLENALRDPVSGEIGKSIVFAVSQNHAAKLTNILNEIAHRMFPGRYISDFAVQVTSQIPEAQKFTVNFTNNRLLGSGNFFDGYKTSKARVCVTVGMMTTGYDCPDILNIGLFRPVFSPTDFIQIKGRGTRKHYFRDQLFDDSLLVDQNRLQKTAYKLFDFFANCEYFEDDFNYDEILELPQPGNRTQGEPQPPPPPGGTFEYLGPDPLETIKVQEIGVEGMKIDRMFFQSFEDQVKRDKFISEAVEAGEWDRVLEYVNRELFNKPEEYYTLDKLRRAAEADRRLSLREILEKVFGLIPGFKSKDELLEEEFAKFIADEEPDDVTAIPAMKYFFKAYVTSDKVRHIIREKDFVDLANNPGFNTNDFRAVPERYRTSIPEYINDYVPVKQFEI